MPNVILGKGQYDNSVGDLEERSRSTNESDWPLFSYSQSQTWDACEWRWDLSYRKRWSLDRKSFALSVGTLVHDGMDVYYGNEKSYEAVELWQKTVLEEAAPDQIPEISRAFYIMDLYVKKFARSEDIGHEALGTELHVVAPFKTPEGRNYWLQGYVDLLVKYKGEHHIWDHKTTGNGFWSDYQVKMSPQLPLYCAIFREEGLFRPTMTVLNQLNTYPYKNWKDVPAEKLFSRVSAMRTDREIDTHLLQFSKLVDSCVSRYKEPRKSLGYSCDKCWAKEVCYLDNKGINIQPILAQKFTKREETVLNGAT